MQISIGAVFVIGLTWGVVIGVVLFACFVLWASQKAK